jgi:hypothetical protein
MVPGLHFFVFCHIWVVSPIFNLSLILVSTSPITHKFTKLEPIFPVAFICLKILKRTVIKLKETPLFLFGISQIRGLEDKSIIILTNKGSLEIGLCCAKVNPVG